MINVSPINVLHFLPCHVFISFFYFDLQLSVIIFHCNVEIAWHHFFLILWSFLLKSAFFMGYFCFHLSHLCNLCRYFLFVKGLPWWLRQLSVCLQCGRPGFDPWVGKIPWRRKWQSTPVLLPGKSHGQRSLVGYSPWGRKESDTTERLHFHFLFVKYIQILTYLSNFAIFISFWSESFIHDIFIYLIYKPLHSHLVFH